MADVRARPHHFLCMMTYVGLGYTPAFTDNLNTVVTKINAGSRIELVEGPDDVCTGLHGDAAENGIRRHCDGNMIARRDEMALRDINRAIGMEWKIGQKIVLTAPAVAKMREAFAEGITRGACGDCQWQDVCTEIASRDFQNAKLHPPLVQIANVNEGSAPVCVTGRLSIRRQPLVSQDA